VVVVVVVVRVTVVVVVVTVRVVVLAKTHMTTPSVFIWRVLKFCPSIWKHKNAKFLPRPLWHIQMPWICPLFPKKPDS